MKLAFWERQMGLDNCDVMIVGAGIVGLAAGLALRKHSDQTRITLIDRSPFSDGGSTRNAGFACFGSPRELLEDAKQQGEAAMRQTVERRLRGLALLTSELGAGAIGLEATGSLEVSLASDVHAHTTAAEIDWLNAFLGPITGRKATFTTPPKSSLQGIDGERVASVWHSPLEGMLQTSALMLTLEQRAAQAGLVIRRGLQVRQMRVLADGRAELDIEPAFVPPGSQFTVTPVRTLLTINGATQLLVPDADVARTPNLVLVTKPLRGPLPVCPIHAEGGYIYARPLPTGQMLVGGGRHCGKASETEVERRLLDWLGEIVPVARGAEVAMRWTGHLGIGSSRSTRIEQVAPHVFGAWRLGGMGVATGMMVGKELAHLSRK